MQLAVKEWRARFSVENRETRVVGIVSGSKASQLAGRQPRCGAYYFGKLTGTDLVIDAGGLCRPLLAGKRPRGRLPTGT